MIMLIFSFKVQTAPSHADENEGGGRRGGGERDFLQCQRKIGGRSHALAPTDGVPLFVNLCHQLGFHHLDTNIEYQYL